MVSLKATSQFYCLPEGTLSGMNEDLSTGFACAGIKIVGEDSAVNVAMFRDVTDLEFFVQDGVEYARSSNDCIFIREDLIPELTLETAAVVIGPEGYAQYYNIGTEVEGKTLAVDLPPAGAFAVYDAEGNCVEFTTVIGNSIAVLPAQGRIVLIGRAGDVFTLHYQ